MRSNPAKAFNPFDPRNFDDTAQVSPIGCCLQSRMNIADPIGLSSSSCVPVKTMATHILEALPAETHTVVVNICLNGSTFNCDTTSSGAGRFLGKHLPDVHGLVKLLLPSSSGHVIQSDFLERRMVDCQSVCVVSGFVAPGQRLEGFPLREYQTMPLSTLLKRSYGAVVVRAEDCSSELDISAVINDELGKRLSFAWLASSPVERKRIALVGGASLAKVTGFAVAASSLNVSLVVLDEASHWMSDESYTHLREEFVPFDMTPDVDMAQRIATRLKRYQEDGRHLDGVMTVDEHLLTIVARAAALLDLDASPPASVALAQNKFHTRQLDTNVYCRLVTSPDDFEKMLLEDGPMLRYPLIVKPAKGWSSEGVWKVGNEKELRNKVPLLWQQAFTAWHGHDVVIENYVEGPEVDANMVLVNGEVVFFEVNDDFPSPGDYDSDNLIREARVANFVETSNMLPSGLPSSELELLRQRLHELALAAGFRDGVLHIEAKLQNSSCHYARESVECGAGDLVDLRPKVANDTDVAVRAMTSSDVFLLEINPRAPGWQEIEATARAYGVSYYTLSVLHAIRDRNRMTSLSVPFEDGAQYHMQLLFVSALKGGTYSYGDICATILSQHKDDLNQRGHGRARIISSTTLMEDGQEVPDPSTGMVYGNFIAFFLIASRESRAEAIRLGNLVERVVREHTDGF
jgi:hypothetical protein